MTVPVGREDDLARACQMLDQMTAGPAALLLTGPAGIGKTTVWRALLGEARALGIRTLETRAVEAEAQLPFGGLADLLDPVLDEVIGELPPAQRAALEVALQRVPAAAMPPAPLAVSLGTLAVLRALAEPAPVLVAIDDVVWLDGASTRVLAYAARRLGGDRIGLVAAARTRDPDGPAPSPMDEVDGPVARLHLEPLGLDAIAELLRRELGAGLRRPALAWIHEASGGNPFAALEIGRAIERTGIEPGIDGLALSVAPGVLVRDRLAALPDGATEPLAAVAALTRPTTALLRAAYPEADAGLDAARVAGILLDDGPRLRFAHPLLAAGAYVRLDVAGRRRVHARLASCALEPVERARHLALSIDGPSEPVAAELEDAAVHARARGASDAAAELVLQAARLTPPDEPAAAGRRMVSAGTWLIQAGDPVRAREVLAAHVAAQPPGPARAEVLLVLADARSSDDWTMKIRLLEEALLEAGDDHRLRSRMLEALAQAYWYTQADARSSIGLARAAVAEAEQQDDPAARVSAYGSAVFAILHAGEGIDQDLLDRALALAPRVEHLRVFLWPQFMQALVDHSVDRHERSLATLEQLRRRATEAGDWDSLPLIVMNMAFVCERLGRWPDALAHALEAERAARATGQALSVSLALAARGNVEILLGHLDDGRRSALEGIRVATAAGAISAAQDARALLGQLALSLGDAKAAMTELGPVVEQRLASGLVDPAVLWMLPLHAEALVGAGRSSEAAALLDRYEPAARRLERRSATVAALRVRGLLAAAAGDEARAGDAFAEALALHRDLTEPFAHGRTLLAQGESMRRFRRRGQAREALEAALAIFDRLGAAVWRERAASELARTGYRETGDRLTPTERQVAELVVAGRTNREVAEILFMSPHTVEAHLTRIYRSLGIRGRTALARALPEALSPAGDEPQDEGRG